ARRKALRRSALRGVPLVRNRRRNQYNHAQDRRDQQHDDVLGDRKIDFDRSDAHRLPPRNLPRMPERQLDRVRVRDVRHDDVRRSLRAHEAVAARSHVDLMRRSGVGRRALGVHRRGRRHAREREDERTKSHRFRSSGSTNVVTKKNVAKLRSAGSARSPNARTNQNPITASAASRSNIPKPQAGNTFVPAPATSNTTANANDCTANAMTALTSIACASPGNRNNRPSKNAPTTIRTAAAATKRITRFIARLHRHARRARNYARPAAATSAP